MNILNKNFIAVVIIIAGLLVAGTLFYLNQSGFKKLTKEEASTKAINYINNNLLAEGREATLKKVTEESGLYKLTIEVGGQEFPSYVTQDGKILFPQGIVMETKEKKKETKATGEVPKRDRPDVKLFVMSYCPFGLMSEKMFLPVYDLLKDKAEMGIYFVDYAMHGKKELDENLTQYCIQKEEKEKFDNYLSCFVLGGESEKCLNQANIDQGKLSSCVSQTDQKYKVTEQYNNKKTWVNGKYPKFEVQADLNEKYGVEGSPTIVINDQIVTVSPRSPENFKKKVCSAFNSPPEECSQTLSEEVPSPGLGEGTTESSGGSCE